MALRVKWLAVAGATVTSWCLAAPPRAPVAAPPRQPSEDPHDLTGTWRVAEPADAADGLAGPEDGRRPGPRVTTRIDLNHVCWIASGLAPATTTIYQRGSQLAMVKADSLRARRIYLNESHPPKIALTHAGHSVGRWDGDTLIIDTVALKGALQTDDVDADTGRFSMIMSTPTLHVVERLSKIDDGAKLRQEVSFDDQATGMQPYTITRTYQYAPRSFTPEAECELDGDALVATDAAVLP
jgi:hypothetical protein